MDHRGYIEKCKCESGRSLMAGAPADTEACGARVLEAPLHESDAAELAQVFAALADPVRLRLLSLIAAAGEICSCDLLGPLDRSQPTVSHHTKVLADAGLIAGEKRGRWVWGSIGPARVAAGRSAPVSAGPVRA